MKSFRHLLVGMLIILVSLPLGQSFAEEFDENLSDEISLGQSLTSQIMPLLKAPVDQSIQLAQTLSHELIS